MINLIHELRIKKERLIPQYTLRMIQAELSFYRECIQYCENIERELFSIGQVEPIPFEGVPGYSLNLGDEEGDESFTTTTTSYTQQTYTPPSNMPQTSLPQARGEFPFQAQSGNELSFNQGDILTIVSQQGDWWVARLNGNEGLIPSNYVRLLS